MVEGGVSERWNVVVMLGLAMRAVLLGMVAILEKVME